MPIIDFKCERCNKEFFQIVKSSDEKVKCPNCGNEEVNRVYKGKFYGKSNCGGNCSGCSGCH